MKKQERKQSAELTDNQKHDPERKTATKAELIEKAIQNIEQKLASNEVKATFGDFIRLLQIQKELQTEQPREIKVTWIESYEMEPALGI